MKYGEDTIIFEKIKNNIVKMHGKSIFNRLKIK